MADNRSIVRVGKYFLSALVLLISFTTAYGSSIIVVRNNDEIVIGTDSKRLRTSRGDLSDAKPELVCKISQADNIFVVSAGLVGFVPSRREGTMLYEFDLTEIMNKAVLGEGSLISKADALASAVESPLSRISEWARKRMPDLFRQMFGDKQLLQVVLAGIENGSPTIVVIAFEPGIKPSGEIEIKAEASLCPGTVCPSGFVYIFLGKHEAIDRYLPLEPEIWKNDPVDVVRRLIALEAASEPEIVGLPIDILRITKERAEWIQEKEICEDRPQSRMPDHYSPIVSPWPAKRP